MTAGGSRLDPACRRRGFDAVCGHPQDRPRKVLYAHHPWFADEVWVHPVIEKADGVFFRCTLERYGDRPLPGDSRPDVDRAWFSQCHVTRDPFVSLDTLRALSSLLALPFDGLSCSRQDGRSPQAGACSGVHREALNQTQYLALHALKSELAARGVKVSHNAVWTFQRREGLRFKKRCSLLNRAVPMSPAGAAPRLRRHDRAEIVLVSHHQIEPAAQDRSAFFPRSGHAMPAAWHWRIRSRAWSRPSPY